MPDTSNVIAIKMKFTLSISIPRLIVLLLALAATDHAFASTASRQAENRRAERQAEARRAEARREQSNAEAWSAKETRHEEHEAEARRQEERRNRRRAERYRLQEERLSQVERASIAAEARRRHRLCSAQKQAAVREGSFISAPSFPSYCTHLEGYRNSHRVTCC